MLAARGLRPLIAAEILSTTGAAMTALALPWLVLSSTGSPARAGIVVAVEWLPMALLGIPSGALATRLGPRRTMIACDLARAPLVAAIAAMYWLGALEFGILLALAFLLGAFFPAHLASQRAILPHLLGETAGDVIRGNAVLGAANRLPIVLGPALGGALIAAVGAPEVLVADALTYALSALLLLRFVPEPPAAAPEQAAGGDLWAGARAIARSPVLRPLTVANDRRAALAGALVAAWGAGALTGTVLALRLAARRPVALVRAALVAQALPIWLVAAPVPPLLLGLALLLSGLANPVANAPSFTLVTLAVPEPLRPKATLAFLTAALAAGGVGLFVTGPAAAALGARHVILGAAALATACAVGFAFATRGAPMRRAEVI